MESDLSNNLYQIFPEALYIVDRDAPSSWILNNYMNLHNLMLIYEGTAEFTCNNSKFQASRGDLVYYKIGDFREAHTLPDNRMKCFAVDFLYTCPIYEDNEWKLINTSLPFSSIQKINDEYLFCKLIDLFSLLTKSALSSKVRNRIKERSLFTEILMLLLEYKKGNQYNYTNIRKVDKIINYMTENYTNNITLQELSNYVHTSPSYLGNIFKQITGKSTINYFIEIRLNKAKSLLTDGFTVSETSKLVGFNDVFYFSRVFKKFEGISPSQYVNLYKGEF
ncbi:MAG: helix-turn-helix transcriptional regulator [Clostridiaceae bacterium]|nr:helix-turn-helix transcriptional regulator [Clostridiaceae bacterium]